MRMTKGASYLGHFHHDRRRRHDDSQRYWAGIAAAEFINLHLHSDEPAHIVYSRLERIILAAMLAAEQGRRLEPSDN